MSEASRISIRINAQAGHAFEGCACVMTKDEAFASRKARGEAGPTLVWIRLPNARRRSLLTWFEKAAPDILSALERGETLIEVI